MKSFLASLFDNTKRCGECKEPLEEQALGVDGAFCDECVAKVAPWALEVVDPYLLALWSIGGHGYGHGHSSSYDHAYMGIDEPF